MKNSSTPQPKDSSTVDQLISAMPGVKCEFPNDREYCADMAGQIRTFPITQETRQAIKQLLSAKLSELLEKLPKEKRRSKDKVTIIRNFLGSYDTRTKNLMAIQNINGFNTALTEVREAIEKMLEEL